MTQETNTPTNGLSAAKNERFVIAHEASIHLYEATKKILEKGYDKENEGSLAAALAYNIVASNLLYTNADVDVEKLMPIVQSAQAALSALLKFQPAPVVQTELPLTTDESPAAEQLSLDGVTAVCESVVNQA